MICFRMNLADYNDIMIFNDYTHNFINPGF
jgi:hypothetical protein